MDLTKLLVVDDSKTFNNMVSALFKNLGYEVEQAFSLSEVKDKLLEFQIDYIILDLNLTDGKADDIIEYIKQTTNAKIIVMTADENSEYRDSMFEKGIIDYFLKTTPIKIIVNSSHSIIQTLETYKNSTILTIDDSKFVRGMLKNILESKGFGVVEASDAKEGFNVLMDHEIDLILLDIIMPGMNGIKFLEELKSNPKYFDIPVIVISADQSRDHYARVLKQGANDFIKKPFIVEDVLLKCDIHIKSFKNQQKLLLNKEKLLKQEIMLDMGKEKVKEHTRYNQRFLEASIDPFVIISKDGKVVDINSSASAIFEQPRENIIGTEFHSYFMEPELMINIHKRFLNEQKPDDTRLKYCNTKGEILELLYNGSVYNNEKENISHTFLTLRESRYII